MLASTKDNNEYNNCNEYNTVELDLRRIQDARKLKEVLNRCYGRLPMRKRDTIG